MPIRDGLSPTSLDRHFGPGKRRRGDHPERGRRNVAGHVEGPANQPLAAAHGDDGLSRPTCTPKALERALGVVARRHRLDDPCRPFSMQPAKRTRALDLRAWHIRLEIDGVQAIRADDRQRRPAFGSVDPRAHPLERHDDPAASAGGAASCRR